MPTATTSKADRRHISSEFKERKVPQGIFAIRCTVSGQVWVGSSPNLNAANNSNWFQLRSGVHRNKTLQAAWTQHGEPSFLFEVAEQFEEEIAALNLRDHMALKKSEWAEALQAEVL
jgi:hypothetical protein